jgi:hypothetical protein
MGAPAVRLGSVCDLDSSRCRDQQPVCPVPTGNRHTRTGRIDGRTDAAGTWFGNRQQEHLLRVVLRVVAG